MAVIESSLKQETLDRYLTYALSVVSDRALPDVRDGLKPVQRRILYAMERHLKLKPSGSFKKSAAVVGEVLAKFHPHGDVACYEAMVRMAQDFSLRYPLVDGQGNFGSVDGDSPAAYRYTEAKLKKLALEVVGEIEEETVNFRDNFDASILEPQVLPSKVPNLLMNGATGIAVGMATSIPPHNLRELVKGIVAINEDPDITTAQLTNIIKGPDFPTGCLILNSKKEIVEIYQSGRGGIRMRGEWEMEEGSRGKRLIIIKSIPYALNKSQLVEKIANLIIGKKIPQLVDIRDESTSDVRVVLELAPGADEEAAMAYIYKNTPLENTFSVNLTALVPMESGACRPELLSLKQCLQHFLDFRYEVVQKRLEFERRKLKERTHILEGLVLIYDALDEVIKIVRKSEGRSDAAEKLRKRFKLSEIQAYAVVDMRIYQLSKTNIKEVKEELAAKLKRIEEITAILKSKTKIGQLVIKDLEEAAKEFGDNRICKIVKGGAEIEFNEEDYVVKEEVYAIVTKDGWVKRIRTNNELSTTRLREGDEIYRAHSLTTLDAVAFVTNTGSFYVLKVSDIPSSSGYGSPVQKLLKFQDSEKIIESFSVCFTEQEQVIPGTEDQYLLYEEDELLLLSKKGMGFVIKVDAFDSVKRNGRRIMKLKADDELVSVNLNDKKIAMFTNLGSGLLIDNKDVPVREAAAVGVSLMGVRKDDSVIGCVTFATKATVELELSSGKTKDIESSDIVKGHRSLKGNKVVARGEIIGVRKK